MSGPRHQGHLLFWLIVLGLLAGIGAEDPCTCVSVEQEGDWSLLMTDPCCIRLNLSVDILEWNVFTPLHSLRFLDLSSSGILEITDSEGGRNQTLIEILYMNHNHLMELPEGFLRNAPNLRVLHLESNKLLHLPSNFLQVSDHLEELHLSNNHLTSFPVSLLRPSLTIFGFVNNSLDCTCSLYDQLEPKFGSNVTRKLLEEVTCASPKDAHGHVISDLTRSVFCRSHSLTVALICIPLVVMVLLLFWYICCRRRKEAYPNTRECSLVTVDRNGASTMGGYHHYEPRNNFQSDRREEDGLQFNDPVFLRPSAALLRSNRDLYEEVEIKLGNSADSLVDDDGREGQEGAGLMLAVAEEEEAEELEIKLEEAEEETVSVTEVMKDSSDREKLYLNQTTDYYSLVPEIELEDSDHCEYESIDLY